MRIILCTIVVILAGCAKDENVVIVYASQDQIYAEPILNTFTRQTGVRVRAVYDSEAVKTVGLVNRLIAEKDNPQCDVFWNNEELRTRQLQAKGIVDHWTPLGSRTRRIVVNTNLVSSPPKSLLELTNTTWRRRIALAYPLFGTTATHFLALRQHWGPESWERWCRALQANQPLLVDGNSVVVQMVGRGESALGLTDSDDIAAGQKQGMPILALPLEELSLVIPNTIALVRNGPHRAEAQHLLDYLRMDAVRRALIVASALEESTPESIGLQVDWPKLFAGLDAGTATIKEVFLR